MVPGLAHKRVLATDGTEIGYQVRGRGPGIVLANGLGGTFEAYRHIFDALGERYRVLCWDYRGLYESGTPANRDTFTVEHQCDDLEVLMDHEGMDRAVFIGWSMGVQVNFEYFRKRRARMDGIVAINGTYGRPFRTAMSTRVVEHVIPMLLKALRAQADFVGKTTRAVVGWEGLVGAMKRFGLVSETLDVDAFRDVAEGFKDLDWKNYTDLMQRLGEHDAEDVLHEIDIPVLVITGDRDIMTPAFTAERLHRSIRGSRLVIIRGGTHYTPVEYPRVVQEELLDFLARIPGYAPAELDDSATSGAAPREHR